VKSNLAFIDRPQSAREKRVHTNPINYEFAAAVFVVCISTRHKSCSSTFPAERTCGYGSILKLCANKLNGQTFLLSRGNLQLARIGSAFAADK